MGRNVECNIIFIILSVFNANTNVVASIMKTNKRWWKVFGTIERKRSDNNGIVCVSHSLIFSLSLFVCDKIIIIFCVSMLFHHKVEHAYCIFWQLCVEETLKADWVPKQNKKKKTQSIAFMHVSYLQLIWLRFCSECFLSTSTIRWIKEWVFNEMNHWKWKSNERLWVQKLRNKMHGIEGNEIKWNEIKLNKKKMELIIIKTFLKYILLYSHRLFGLFSVVTVSADFILNTEFTEMKWLLWNERHSKIKHWLSECRHCIFLILIYINVLFSFR